jgi:hypothetical protein
LVYCSYRSNPSSKKRRACAILCVRTEIYRAEIYPDNTRSIFIGTFIALGLALEKLFKAGTVASVPIRECLAAVTVGHCGR